MWRVDVHSDICGLFRRNRSDLIVDHCPAFQKHPVLRCDMILIM